MEWSGVEWMGRRGVEGVEVGGKGLNELDLFAQLKLGCRKHATVLTCKEPFELLR